MTSNNTIFISPALSTMLLHQGPTPPETSCPLPPGRPPPPSCLICFDDIPWRKRNSNNGARAWSHLNCGQHYHEKCYQAWQNQQRQRGNDRARCPHCIRLVDVHVELANGARCGVEMKTVPAPAPANKGSRFREFWADVYDRLILEDSLFRGACINALITAYSGAVVLVSPFAAILMLLSVTTLVLALLVLVPPCLGRSRLRIGQLKVVAGVMVFPLLVAMVGLLGFKFFYAWVVDGEENPTIVLKEFVGRCNGSPDPWGLSRWLQRWLC